MAAQNPGRAGAAVKPTEERTQPAAQKITTFLWYNGNAEEAANFYVSIFKNSRILHTVPYGEAGPGKAGSVMTVDFELDGQRFTALNGGPEFKFTEAISLLVHCKDQKEVDYFWEKLSEGGQTIECGWLKDKFGVAWQITPDIFLELIGDPRTSDKAMKAMMKMKKLDIAELKKAVGQ